MLSSKEKKSLSGVLKQARGGDVNPKPQDINQAAGGDDPKLVADRETDGITAEAGNGNTAPTPHAHACGAGAASGDEGVEPTPAPAKQSAAALMLACTKTLELKQIKTTDGTQVRELNLEVVEDYEQSLKNNPHSLPPVEVFSDGTGFWLADGFHRHEASKLAGLKSIRAQVHTGGHIDALKQALGSNVEHGYRRTREDKRRAVVKALTEFSDRSDRFIAELCKVSPTYVGSIRNEEFPTTVHMDSPTPAKRVGRDDKARKVPREQKTQALTAKPEVNGDAAVKTIAQVALPPAEAGFEQTKPGDVSTNAANLQLTEAKMSPELPKGKLPKWLADAVKPLNGERFDVIFTDEAGLSDAIRELGARLTESILTLAARLGKQTDDSSKRRMLKRGNEPLRCFGLRGHRLLERDFLSHRNGMLVAKMAVHLHGQRAAILVAEPARNRWNVHPAFDAAGGE